jgi:signal transduction histidine kinase
MLATRSGPPSSAVAACCCCSSLSSSTSGARRVAGGELDVRVAEESAAQLGDLERAFNTMVRSLEENRDELETQNAELHAQQAEVERALDDLAVEKQRIETILGFAGSLAAETELTAIAAVVLAQLARGAHAEVGALYVAHSEQENGSAPLRLLATVGASPATLPLELQPGHGIVARALAERQPVETPLGASALRLEAFGQEIEVRREYDIPFVRGDRAVGVAMLGRVTDSPLADEVEFDLRALADYAAIALSNALDVSRTLRLAALNSAVLDATLDAIAMVDANGRVVVENAAMQRLRAELEQAEIEGDEGALATGLTGDAASASDDPITVSTATVELAGSGRSFVRYRAPLVDANGTLLGRFFSVRETTDERALDRMKDEFLATVSHELRTPLTSIIGFVDILLTDEVEGLTEEQRHDLEIVQRNAHRLLRLVGDLLFVSRLEAGMLELEHAPVDIDALAEAAVEAARPSASAKMISLDLAAGGVPAFDGDPGRIAQLIDNLLSNAVKFTPEGGEVAVRTVRENGTAVLEVADSGVGIPRDEQSRLFDRFFRASTATDHAVPGTGLGLTITRAIAELHGGTVSVTDRSGGGTVFRVELPL